MNKFEDPIDSKLNNNYISYVQSLKKIEDTNSNKVSSLHSKINLNSHLSNNEEDSEISHNILGKNREKCENSSIFNSIKKD